jgi:predicted kinase
MDMSTKVEARSGQTKKGNLFYMVGSPKSGKSTIANKWVKDLSTYQLLEGEYNPRVVIGGDDFRTAITSREFIPEAEGLVFAAMDVAARALLARGFDVLIDETSTTKASLLRYYKLDINATPIIVDTSANECVKRAITSSSPYLVAPIMRISKQFDKLMENFDEIIKEVKAEVRERSSQDVHV